MAEITPITREEFYLAKAGGQDVPVPSAVTREEYYFEKLTNDNVDVPTPVTRREKFLYFASGGEIDLPSEEKMTRLERLIAKAGGMDISTPTAVTRLEKFWANVEGGGWKTITGVLPLTFTAKGGTAGDWVIYGNDDNGTEQLMNCSTISGGVLNEYGVVIGADATTNIHADNGSISFTTGSAGRGIVTDFTEIKSDVENVTLTYSGDRAANWRFCFYDNSQTFISQSPDIDRQTRVVVIPNNTKYFRASAQYETAGTYSLTSLSIVKGSTAPDHYIPYQQGVGERTENLFNFATYKSKLQLNPVPVIRGTASFGDNCITITASSNDAYTQSYSPINQYVYTVTVEPNTQYTLSWKTDDATINGQVFIFWYEGEGNTYKSGTSIQQSIEKLTITTTSTTNKLSFRFGVQSAGESLTYSDIMLVKGSTAPTSYIPYGYQIPLTVSQQGQTDKTVDIYIGDSQLTEGETVSKTSTGVDIELFEGENVVSTTLYNKPAMEIKYK